jgi:hypothetical protein
MVEDGHAKPLKQTTVPCLDNARQRAKRLAFLVSFEIGAAGLAACIMALSPQDENRSQARAPTARAAAMIHSMEWLVAGGCRVCHPAVPPRSVAPCFRVLAVCPGKVSWAGPAPLIFALPCIARLLCFCRLHGLCAVCRGKDAVSGANAVVLDVAGRFSPILGNTRQAESEGFYSCGGQASCAWINSGPGVSVLATSLPCTERKTAPSVRWAGGATLSREIG